MILATVRIPAEQDNNVLFTESFLFNSEKDFIEATFSPSIEIVTVIRFQLHGNTYSERKESLRDLAIECSNSEIADLSYSEECDIYWYFLENGKRYGLLKEFMENAII